MKWEVDISPWTGKSFVIKQWPKCFDTEREAQAFADQLNTKCLSTDPAWAAKAEERMAERQNANQPWDVVD